jgi:hypothetical protein
MSEKVLLSNSLAWSRNASILQLFLALIGNRILLCMGIFYRISASFALNSLALG